MVDLDRLRDWVPRLLAPVAFFVAATVLILLVQNALSSDDGPATPPTTPAGVGSTLGTETDPGQTETTRRARKRFYRVKSGDLLETIAAERNTSVAQLLELNPDIDPQALTVGERIRVR